MKLSKVFKLSTLAMLLLSLSAYAQPQTKALLVSNINSEKSLEEAAPLNTETYCNEDFQFCFRYPADMFTEINESDSGDGVFLKTPDGNTQIIAYAYRAVGENMQATRSTMMKLILEKFDPTKVSVELITNEDLMYADLPNGHFVYTHTQLHDDKWITIEVQVENQAGKDDDLIFKYLTELVTQTLEMNDVVN